MNVIDEMGLPTRYSIARTGQRSRQKAETRAAILRAATALFADWGYEATTIRQIAARAGVAPGTVIHHFASKPDLLLALYDTVLARLYRDVAKDLPSEGPLHERLAWLVDRMLALALEEDARLYATVQAYSWLWPSETEAFYQDRVDQARAIVQRVLREAAAEGELAGGIDLAQLAETVLDLIVFAVRRALFTDRSRAAGRAYVLPKLDLVLAGLIRVRAEPRPDLVASGPKPT